MGSPVPDEKQLQLPVVDFRGVDPNNPTSTEWVAARTAVVRALESSGCFEAIYDAAGPDLSEQLFGRVMPELFALPLEAKKKNTCARKPYMGYGYIGGDPGWAYDSLRVDGAATMEGVQEFATLMWPQGNPDFCAVTLTYSKHMHTLIQMVQRMILESLGLEKYCDYHLEPKDTGLRFSEYNVSLDQKTIIGMGPHTDTTMFTIVCQDQVGGLEVQTKNGEWIQVVPSANSVTFITGESFTAWTNGRFLATRHRVKMTTNGKRYSVIFGTEPSVDCMIQPLKELVDANHPLLYNAFSFKDYLRLRFSEEGKKYSNILEAYHKDAGEVKI